MSGVRFAWALLLGLALPGLFGCASPSTQPALVAPAVTATLPPPLPTPAPSLTERDAIAVVRAHGKPTMWVALHSELRDHTAGKALVASFTSATFEQAKIDPATEIDALVSGCAIESGCFTLVEHHISSDRIRRFLDVTAEKSSTPAEWLSQDPPSVRVSYTTSGKGVAVLTQVNENLLLASLRPAPELVKALEKTRGLEPSRDGYVAVGGMSWNQSGLVDGLSLRMKVDGDGALAGDLRGTATEEQPPTLTADLASRKLKIRFDTWWLAGIFKDDFQFELTGRELHMPVRIEPSHLEAIAAGLRIAMRFR
ncbi:MAG: hypothetical protein HOV80_15030 [Polyangiaceae bacterium]|nr:hypothetical protein [Polyangiaceae bacterium]